MMQGSCTKVKNLTTWLHLIINIISTVLLACSNYCMQTMCAPTRKELVQAHNERFYLSIGVQSMRNIAFISARRRFLWLMLFISSIPLHLLFVSGSSLQSLSLILNRYNSMIIATLQANEYSAMPITEQFLNGGVWSTAGLIDVPSSKSSQIALDARKLREKLQETVQSNRLTTGECFNTYSKQYISNVGDVLLVQQLNITWHWPDKWAPRWLNGSAYDWTAPIHASYYEVPSPINSSTEKSGPPEHIPLNKADKLPFYSTPDNFPSYGWICPSRSIQNCSTSSVGERSMSTSTWAPYGDTIDYCIAEIVDENCKLQFSLVIGICVILCNAAKVACMLYILYRCQDTYLVTLSDAIASLLDSPDPVTKGRCLDSFKRISREWFVSPDTKLALFSSIPLTRLSDL